jgi:hypothetical protein
MLRYRLYCTVLNCAVLYCTAVTRQMLGHWPHAGALCPCTQLGCGNTICSGYELHSLLLALLHGRCPQVPPWAPIQCC